MNDLIKCHQCHKYLPIEEFKFNIKKSKYNKQCIACDLRARKCKSYANRKQNRQVYDQLKNT